MTNITEQTIIKLDIKIIMLLTGLIIATVTSWATLSYKVEENTKQIQQVTSSQKQHISEYRKMNMLVIKNNEQLKNIEKNTDEIKETLKYLRRKAEKE